MLVFNKSKKTRRGKTRRGKTRRGGATTPTHESNNPLHANTSLEVTHVNPSSANNFLLMNVTTNVLLKLVFIHLVQHLDISIPIDSVLNTLTKRNIFKEESKAERATHNVYNTNKSYINGIEDYYVDHFTELQQAHPELNELFVRFRSIVDNQSPPNFELSEGRRQIGRNKLMAKFGL